MDGMTVVTKKDTIVTNMVTRGPDDLELVLFGKIRGAILALLLNSPDELFYVRRIARLTGAPGQ
jgi:hypothetical protein